MHQIYNQKIKNIKTDKLQGRISLLSSVIITSIVIVVFVAHLINTSKNSFPNPDIVFAQMNNKSIVPHSGPILRDSHLAIEMVATGINFPASMSFLDSDDILVTEKNTGMVKRILNGVIIKEPLLSVNVENYLGRWLARNCR